METRADKELKYSELFRGDRCRLVVVALETGGRWSPEAVDFIDRLATARARDAPPNLQRSAFLAWIRQWTLCSGGALWREVQLFRHSSMVPIPWVSVQVLRGSASR